MGGGSRELAQRKGPWQQSREIITTISVDQKG
jgi:hypothetical protein